jgi:hypothetical protein
MVIASYYNRHPNDTSSVGEVSEASTATERVFVKFHCIRCGASWVVDSTWENPENSRCPNEHLHQQKEKRDEEQRQELMKRKRELRLKKRTQQLTFFVPREIRDRAKRLQQPMMDLRPKIFRTRTFSRPCRDKV